MPRAIVVAERLMAAPAAVVYSCVADYQRHHRPGGFLPRAFRELTVVDGGVGAGTRIQFTMTLAGRPSQATATISEPEPGRVLVESTGTVRTTFTVEPRAQDHARVHIETVLTQPGLQGWISKLVAGRMLRPVYADELVRLEQYAQEFGRKPEPRTAWRPNSV